ncbi:MAG TPA: hypothetical protein VKM55_14585 [Candidatus Lokiarchaeia archaeon]|nr:hypothetical protein [Candidatus Lokiarchaeia archaeon]
MALIMVTGTYPPHKFKELMEIYGSSNKPPYPATVTKVHNWAVQVTSGLYKIYAVYECPDDQIAESLGAITKHYNFYAQVEGYRFTLELLSNAEEAIQYMISD